MSENRNVGIFSAADLRRRMAEREAAKAAEEVRRLKEQEEKQKAVMEEFHKPADRTPEQLMERVMELVNRAADRGQSEVQVYRFPNSLCTDRGRRINNSEPDWDQTLEGRPRAGYEFWRDHLRPLGFHLSHLVAKDHSVQRRSIKRCRGCSESGKPELHSVRDRRPGLGTVRGWSCKARSAHSIACSKRRAARWATPTTTASIMASATA